MWIIRTNRKNKVTKENVQPFFLGCITNDRIFISPTKTTTSLNASLYQILTLLMVKYFILQKNSRCFFGQLMLCCHVTKVLSVIQICTFEETVLHSPTKINQIKNNNSCKVLISCTFYIDFISKEQYPNEKLRLVMWSIKYNYSEVSLF